MSFLGSRQRRHAAEQEFLAHLTGLLEVDRGMAESLRLVLTELVQRLRLRGGHPGISRYRHRAHFCVEIPCRGRFAPYPGKPSRDTAAMVSCSTIPMPAFAGISWRALGMASAGIGKDGRRLKDLPRLPGPMRQELGWQSVMGVTLDLAGHPAGRLMLGNGHRRFPSQDLQWLERIVRHLGQPLQNLFLLRHIRAHAIEGERSRISREIHDGILQTLLSVDIQLDVLRRKVPADPEQAVGGLTSLQQTVRNETDELRRMVTDMRPLRVQSADLVDLMRGFARAVPQ